MWRAAAAFCITFACGGTALLAETVNETKTRILETPQSEIGTFLREIIAEDGCVMVVGDDVERERTLVAQKLAVKMDVPSARVPEVRGLLVHAFERGINQIMRDGDFEIDYATKAMTYTGCKG